MRMCAELFELVHTLRDDELRRRTIEASTAIDRGATALA